MQADIGNYHTEEQVGTIDDDGNLETESGALEAVARPLIEDGIHSIFPYSAEDETGGEAIVYREFHITTDDEGWLREFFDALPSPYDCDMNVLGDLPTFDANERVQEKLDKEWVSDPTEQAPNRWTNTETGEYRYQETKPETGTGLTDEGDSGGAVGDQDLRRAIEQLENPSREDVQEHFGLEEVDWSVYEDEGVDSFDLSTAVSMTLADYDTMEEFNSAVESEEFDVELQDNYSLYSDPDDLAELEGEIAQNIRDDAAQMHVEELVTQNADAVRSVTDEPEIPQGEEDGESTEDEEDENDEGYEDEYESFDLHNVEFSEVSEDDYLVIDGRRGREKIKVQSVEESDSGKGIISGVTPDGRSSGVVSGREGSEILGQLQDGEAYKSDVERGVQETIEQYEDTVQEVKDSFTNSDIRDGLEEFDAGRQGSFNRLSSSTAMELRSAITDAVGDKEAVNELWARMNEMKQSSTGSQRKYVDALAKETFGMEDANTWDDADPDDYDFSKADKEAMAVTAAASQRVLSQAGDNKIHRGVRGGGSAQLAKAWLEDPMATDFEINENATANYSSLEDVARGYGDITVDKDVAEGAVLNANDMIRGMYRSSAAADEAEVWAPGSKQSVSSWDVSIGSERVEGGEYERMYLGDYQGPIEEIEDEKFLRRMSKQVEHLQKSEDIDSLSDEAKKNLQKFGERMDDVLSDYDFDEVVDDLMEKNDSGSVIDLTSEAGWLDELRDEESDGDDSGDDIDAEEETSKEKILKEVEKTDFPAHCRSCGERRRMSGSFHCPTCHPDIDEDKYDDKLAGETPEEKDNAVTTGSGGYSNTTYGGVSGSEVPTDFWASEYMDVQKRKEVASEWEKSEYDYTDVDDMMLAAFKNTVQWEPNEDGDLSKAPNMWQHAENVPEFVKEFVREAIKQGVIWDQFDDIPKAAIIKVEEIFRESLTQPQGWSVHSLTEKLSDEFVSLSSKQAEAIARNETAAIMNTAREEAYKTRPDEEEYQYYWSNPQDHRTTDVCNEIIEEVDSQGGAVDMPTLKDILYDKAKKYENDSDNGGTPQRADEWLPHFECRSTFVREVYL